VLQVVAYTQFDSNSRTGIIDQISHNGAIIDKKSQEIARKCVFLPDLSGTRGYFK
jgi:hypothetical protein